MFISFLVLEIFPSDISLHFLCNLNRIELCLQLMRIVTIFSLVFLLSYRFWLVLVLFRLHLNKYVLNWIELVFFYDCHPEVFNTYINIQWCISQTQKNFIMFIIVLGQHVSILIESSSGPSKNTDPYLKYLKMRCVMWAFGIPQHIFKYC